MPANQHLQWFDIDDFAAGLWSGGAHSKFSAPNTSFVTLDDYAPTKYGALRPFFKPTALSMAGGPGANEVAMGLFARNGVSRAAGVGGNGADSTDIVLVTHNTSDFKFRIWRWDGTAAAPAWSNRFTSTAGSSTASQVTGIVLFKDSAGVEWYLLSISAVSAAQGGLYTMRTDYTVTSNTGNDGLVARIQAYSGPICVSQARVLVGTGNDEKIQYSAVGLTTGFGSSLSVAPNRAESNISIMSSIEPSDLIIGKEGAPWVQISGDVTSAATPVREMGNEHHQRQDKQQVPQVPGGIAFIEGEGRVIVTDGRNFKPISDQISSRSLFWTNGLVGCGQLDFLDGYLFVPGSNAATKSLVYSFETNSWFSVTTANTVFHCADPYGGNVWGVTRTTPPLIYSYNPFSGSRVSTGVIETQPFADKNGRNIDIREVQAFVQCSASTDFVCDLIDQTGSIVSTHTVTGITDRQMVQFLFPNTKSEYLSVRITPTASGSNDAPTFERIRIGFGVNNLIT